MGGKPRFFCESCGAEVPLNASRCPHCGRVFSDVHCPACGFSGPASLFSSGCPVCGYSAPQTKEQGRSEGSSPSGRIEKLPPWVFVVTVAAVVAVLVAAFLIIEL